MLTINIVNINHVKISKIQMVFWLKNYIIIFIMVLISVSQIVFIIVLENLQIMLLMFVNQIACILVLIWISNYYNN